MFVFLVLPLLIASVWGECFKFSGKLAASGSVFSVGELVELTVSSDEFFCERVTETTKLTVEMWEADVFGDDKVLTLGAALTLKAGIEWSVPFDLSAIVSAGGENEDGAEFYFYVFETAATGNKGQSSKFKLSSKGSFITVEGPASSSYATGTTVEFDVLSSKLPSRQIACSLMRPPLVWGLPARSQGEILKYSTTAATGVQKKLVRFALSSALESNGDYYIECKTSDGKQPSVTFTAPKDKWFRINQVKLVVKITAPVANQKPKANTNLRVAWTTDGAGLMAGDKFRVRLFNVVDKNVLIRGTAALFVKDTEVWSSTTAGVAEPLVTALSFNLPIPVELGPVSWLANLLDGRTGNFYVRLTLKSNDDFNLDSPQFQIDTADKGCVINKPTANDSFVFGQDTTFEYSCKGYNPQDMDGRFSLLRSDGSSSPTLTPIDNAARALTAGKIVFKVPESFVQGWVYRVRVTDGSANPQDSSAFLGRRTGNQCTVTDKAARCAGAPVLVATYEHEYQVNSITVTWAGPDCGSQSASLSIATVWQKGAGGAQTTTTTIARVVDNQPLQQKLLGSACPDCLDIMLTFVEFPANRKSLSFDITLVLPTRTAAPLALGTVKYVDAVGAVPAAGATQPCVGNGGIVPAATQAPIVDITDAPGAAETSLAIVGGSATADAKTLTSSSSRSSSMMSHAVALAIIAMIWTF